MSKFTSLPIKTRQQHKIGRSNQTPSGHKRNNQHEKQKTAHVPLAVRTIVACF
jgi:hypothetical protein